MTSAISIREAKPEDWKIYSSLRLEALQESPRVFGGAFAEESRYSAQQWMEWLHPHLKAIFVLSDGKQPIGFTAMMTDRECPATGHFIASYIKPEYRGRRLSDMLFKARTALALEMKDWKKVVTCHREGNEVSQRAIMRNGFVLKDIVSTQWPDGTTGNRYDYELDPDDLRRKNLSLNQSNPKQHGI